MFVGVYSTWDVVPVWADEPGPYEMSSWIGLDGYMEGNLVQAGIDHYLFEPGAVATYYPWYEWVPGDEIAITNLTVQPGDKIHCRIDRVGPANARVLIGTPWVAVGLDLQAPGKARILGQTAEWIVERPTANGVIATLPHYERVHFQLAATRDSDGTQYDLNNNLILVDMVEDDQTLSFATKVGRRDLTVSFSGQSEIVFQGDTGDLSLARAGNNPAGVDMKLGMKVGTSPSISATVDGWQVAFQANTGNLWVVGAQGEPRDLRLGMMPGTSPSITEMPAGGWQVAFQANTGNLWVVGAQGGPRDLRLGMMAGTSPSIAGMLGGGWQTAFQANTGDLWIAADQGPKRDMKLGMMRGTSPSIAAIRGPGWEVAFQANTGRLWLVGTQDAPGDMGLRMLAGTSPSIGV